MHGLLILGGKSMPLTRFARNADIIICADSGADHALTQNITPHFVIGDMDSISKTSLDFCEANDVRMIRHPVEKDATDGEMATDFAHAQGVTTLDIVCGEGMLDHYLGNLYLLLLAEQKQMNAVFHSQHMQVHAVRDTISITGQIGRRVSILPADCDIVVKQTQGLYYEVDKPLRISFGDTVGLGNHLTETHACIIISEGTAFVLLENEKNT